MADPMPSQSLSPALITGGCGFIGFHVVQHLLESEPNCQIHVLDVDTSRNRLLSASITYHTADISSSADVSRLMHLARPRVIFHIACPDSMVIKPALFESVNVGGTRNLLRCAAELGMVQALVFTSTSSVIHDNLTDLLDATEDLPILRPPQQKRVYTLTKAQAEEDILAANRAAGDRSMLTVSLRPATAFGERDTIYLSKIIAVAEKGRNKIQVGNGANLYDLVYVGNLAEAHLLAARALVAAYGRPPPPAEKRVDGENFNITNGERVNFWDFTRTIGARAGFPVKREEIRVIPLWVGLLMGWVSEWIVWLLSGGKRQPNMTMEGIRLSTINRTLNGDKAMRVLGYRPQVSIEEGIERGVKWWLKNRKMMKENVKMQI